MKRLVESCMQFGDYNNQDFFAIENSKLHQSVGEGIKTVEFVLLKKKKHLLFVEAKTTCPNTANRDESIEKRNKFEEYYQDISDKFADSFQMFLSTVLNKSDIKDGIGENLIIDKDYSNKEICFVLVIKNADDISWLAGPKAELEGRLKKLCKIWKSKVIVLNHELAVEYGLVNPISDITP